MTNSRKKNLEQNIKKKTKAKTVAFFKNTYCIKINEQRVLKLFCNRCDNLLYLVI